MIPPYAFDTGSHPCAISCRAPSITAIMSSLPTTPDTLLRVYFSPCITVRLNTLLLTHMYMCLLDLCNSSDSRMSPFPEFDDIDKPTHYYREVIAYSVISYIAHFCYMRATIRVHVDMCN
jgi:hypothetical protein